MIPWWWVPIAVALSALVVIGFFVWLLGREQAKAIRAREARRRNAPWS